MNTFVHLTEKSSFSLIIWAFKENFKILASSTNEIRQKAQCEKNPEDREFRSCLDLGTCLAISHHHFEPLQMWLSSTGIALVKLKFEWVFSRNFEIYLLIYHISIYLLTLRKRKYAFSGVPRHAKQGRGVVTPLHTLSKDLIRINMSKYQIDLFNIKLLINLQR